MDAQNWPTESEEEADEREGEEEGEDQPSEFEGDLYGFPPSKMPETIRGALDEIRNPEDPTPYKPTEKKPWVYHGTRRRHFNSNTYSSFTIRLKNLQNLKSKGTESIGDFMVSLFFKERQYGAYLSGPIDLDSLSVLTRHTNRAPSYLHYPKVILDHEIKLNLRFADLIDAPIVLTVAYVGNVDLTDLEEILKVEPFAYTSLNIINLVKKGKARELLRPLYCTPEKTPYGILVGFPFIEIEIKDFAGLPSSEQLKQGNIMTCVIESMYRLPSEIQEMANLPENEFEIFLSLPFDSSDNALHFPSGILQKVIPPSKYQDFDQGEEEEEYEEEEEEEEGGEPKLTEIPLIRKDSKVKGSKNIPVFMEPRHGAHRHWASLMQYHPDAPRGASVVTGKKRILNVADDKYAITGDLGESSETSWKSYLTSSDPRLVWNSLHRRYMSLEAYKQMIGTLTKQVIWPLEVAITVRKERPSVIPPSSKKESVGEPSAEGDMAISGSTALEAEEPKFELVVVYHGMAFLDMTKLLYPGAKRAHYVCRLQKYDEAVFLASTCALKSAFISCMQMANISYIYDGLERSTSLTAKTEKRESQSPKLKKGKSSESKKSKSPKGKSKEKSPKSEKAKSPKAKKSESPKSKKAESSKSKKAQSPKSKKSKSPKKSKEPQKSNVNVKEPKDDPNSPFIVFQIRMNRSLVPPIGREKGEVICATDYLPLRKFPRKKLLNSTLAQKKYRQAVLEAAAEVSHQFHNEYLDYIVKEGVSRNYLDPRAPASSFENIKKGFLFYLNASGRYLVLREHLRHAVSNIIQQKCTNVQPRGFKSRREFQNFLHDTYLFLVDEMHETLNTTALQEIDPLARGDYLSGSKRSGKGKEVSSKKGWIGVQNLLMYAEESFAQGDYHNAHRLHVERVSQSGESSECWADFGIFWLSRGDDRLAEIAMREALIKNDKNLKALIISGVIAARHNDNRAITCLGAALRLRPICPEILVLIGAAHACLGNDVASEYFFKKARYVHYLLTGKDTSSIGQAFESLPAAWNFAEAAKSLEKAFPSSHSQLHVSELQEQPTARAGSLGGNKTQREKEPSNPKISEGEGASDSVGKSKEKRGRKGGEDKAGKKSGKKANKETDEEADKPRKKSGKPGNEAENTEESDKAKKSDKTGKGGKGKKKSQSPKKGESPKKNKRKSVPQPPPSAPKVESEESKSVNSKANFDFRVEELVIKNRRAIKFAKLPSMGPSILQVLNVTKVSKYVKPNKRPKPKAPAQVVKNNPRENTIKTTSGVGSQRSLSLNIQNPQEMNLVEFEAELESMNEMYGEGYQEERQGESVKSDPDYYYLDESKLGERKEKVISRRTGSEYIWTAHILLKLRLFDFLDGILARELAMGGKRSIPFLYIRALSLHLRQRDKEALDCVNEALRLEPNNAILWALRGHCHYMLRETDSAIQCYMIALKLPHGHENMQLVYLRLGSLCLESGDVKLAKKIFIKGVHSFPSPYMWIATGNICYHLKELSQAETAFAEANRLDSTNPIIWAHLSLVSLAKGHKALAEQSYKWAIRFGLKKSRLMDEIKEMHKKKGFGNPGFPRIPHCIPHDYYLKRLGRDRPFEEYAEALKFPRPKQKRNKYGNTRREERLIKKLKKIAAENEAKRLQEMLKEQQRLEELEASETEGEQPAVIEGSDSTFGKGPEPTEVRKSKSRKNLKLERKKSRKSQSKLDDDTISTKGDKSKKKSKKQKKEKS